MSSKMYGLGEQVIQYVGTGEKQIDGYSYDEGDDENEDGGEEGEAGGCVGGGIG